MAKGKDVYWLRKDVFDNRVSLSVDWMATHISKHAFDIVPVKEDHIFQAVTDPDEARLSNHPHVGNETCIFVKHIAEAGYPIVVPVQYAGVSSPADYQAGGKKGDVTTGYFETGSQFSRMVGPVIWSRPAAQGIALAAEESKEGEGDSA